jgi:hypothetical protein
MSFEFTPEGLEATLSQYAGARDIDRDLRGCNEFVNPDTILHGGGCLRGEMIARIRQERCSKKVESTE